MGIYREEYLFAMGFPSIEAILLAVWKNQKLRIQVSVLESARSDNRSAAEEYLYVLTHPKNSVVSRMLSVYQPIMLAKLVFGKESRIFMVAPTHKSTLLDAVSAALLALGGVKATA